MLLLFLFLGDLVKLSFDQALDHPNAITVYNGYIYWTDRKQQSLMRSAKNGTGHVEKMRTFVGSIRDVHAFVSDRQEGS